MRFALAAVLMLAGPCLVPAAVPRGPATMDLAADPEGAAPAPFDWTAAELVFTGKFDQVVAGPVGQSYPPMYTHTLHFTVEKVLRGTLKAGDKVACSNVARQMKEPVFPVGRTCMVAAAMVRDYMQVLRVEESSSDLLAQVTAACSVPLGWRIEGGKPVSPWAAMGKKAWEAEMPAADTKVVCSKTGRPALMAGGVTLEVVPVPPKVAIQWTNPDGDGQYQVTVTNPTDKPLAVPALLSGGGKVLWEESLVILCQDKAYACPGAKGVSGKVEPTTLAPHQSVSTKVNVLLLHGPEWPQGGYRIEFQFCLGEKGQTQSLYYMTKHHGKLRDELLKSAAPEAPPAAAPVDGHSSRTSLDWNGTYKGTVPSADCAGIETELQLGKDNTFVIRTRYLGKDDGKVFEEKGSFRWDDRGAAITLDGIRNGPTRYQVGETALTQLDADSNKIAGPLAEKYMLKKQ